MCLLHLCNILPRPLLIFLLFLLRVYTGRQYAPNKLCALNNNVHLITQFYGTCGKLPGTLALFVVLGPVCPHTNKPFLPSFLSRHHSHEKGYQALSRFTVLEAMESWVGPGNEASHVPYSLVNEHPWVHGPQTPPSHEEKSSGEPS